MSIFIFSFVSFLTSIGILWKNFTDVIMMFPKKGYFVKSGNYADYNKITNSAVDFMKRYIKLPLLLVPVVNVFYAFKLNRKINRRVFKKFKNSPNFLLPMTSYEKDEFNSTKGISNKFDYLYDLSRVSVKPKIIDAVSFEVIKDDKEKKKSNNEETKKINDDLINSIIEEFKKL